jgi:hypothetical protein
MFDMPSFVYFSSNGAVSCSRRVVAVQYRTVNKKIAGQSTSLEEEAGAILVHSIPL